MLVPVSWLKEYVPTGLTPQEIAHALTMVGLEVERLARHGPSFPGVVTARVEQVEKHPNADKLSLCRVTDGTATYSVVCGAPNVRPGLTVAFARAGACLPGDLKIKRSKIRGVESEGMICSGRELALSGESEGIMELSSDVALDQPLADALGLADWVMEVNVTANRPDCLSMIGIARELAAATEAALSPPDVRTASEHGDVTRDVTVDLEAAVGCPRYSARRVSGIRVGPSPARMQQRLLAAGVRPINNVVDVTNYVMLETGHPMHAFDARHIHQGKIVVRWARAGETLTTLDGVKHALTGQDLLIADPEKPLALGGIMGGELSGIADSTTDVILEAAYFDPPTIRRTSRRLKLHSESSHRFERGCDPAATVRALDRACQLLEEIASGRVAQGTVDRYPERIEPRAITVRSTRVNQVLGFEMERFRMEWLLKRLGLTIHDFVEANLYYDPDKFVVEVPTSRPDIAVEADVIEEIARLYSYDKIPTVAPAQPAAPVPVHPLVRLTREARRVLVGLGLDEAITFAFAPVAGAGEAAAAGAVALSNPLKEEEAALRTSLAGSLVRALVHNVNHQNPTVGLFEIGRVFEAPAPGDGGAPGPYRQEYRAAVLLAGETVGHWRQAARCVDYFAIKGIVEVLMRELRVEWTLEPGCTPVAMDTSLFHPARSARIVVQGQPAGVFGELLPGGVPDLKAAVPVAVAELALQRLLDIPAREITARPVQAFPRADRDLAIVVQAPVRYADVKTAVDEAGGKLLEESRIFDVFVGGGIEPGSKSLALALAFRHPERTLTDAEVDKAVQRILQKLERDFGARLRDR
jgi:phenylalanyl-tRNA synthetase beta chain